MDIRTYKTSDIPQIATLYYETIHKINSRDYNAAQINAWAPAIADNSFWHNRFERCKVFVAEENGIVVGFTEFEGNGHIDCFYAHHAWQARGVGSLLFQAIEDEARQRAIKRLYVEVSITAKPFFLKKGFRIESEVQRPYRGQLFQQYLMEKHLPAD